MSAQRVGLMALRRATAARAPVSFAQQMPRLAASLQSRPITTEKLSPADADALLAQQRLKRPVSPHLQIYDFNQTWLSGSVWQRITGGILTGGLYVFGAAYLVAPLTGWHIESASLAAAVATWPVFAKGGLKFLIAWPFTYHAFTGVRHLVWDTARGFTKASLATTSNIMWFSGLFTAIGLAAFL